MRLTGHRAAVNCFAINFEDPNLIASGSEDANIKIWDIRTGRSTTTYKQHQMPINCIDFSPDGLWVASGGADGALRIWEQTSEKDLFVKENQANSINCLQFNHSYLTLAAASSDKTVSYWDLEKFE